MDRNTITGLVLIGLILTVFSIFNRPSEEDIKKRQQAEEGPVEIKIKYSDTDQTILREALKLVKKWGYDEPPEDITN